MDTLSRSRGRDYSGLRNTQKLHLQPYEYLKNEQIDNAALIAMKLKIMKMIDDLHVPRSTWPIP